MDTKMKKFKYNIVKCLIEEAPDVLELNKLGDEGWELVLSSDKVGFTLYIFKKEIENA